MSLGSVFLWDFNTTSLRMWQKLFILFWQERDMLHTRKIFLKYTRKLSFALVQHSGWRVESDRFWGMGLQHIILQKFIRDIWSCRHNIWATVCHGD